MNIRETDLKGVFEITPARFGDARGWFQESWNAERMAEHGIEVDFVQDNHSFSAAKNTLRGLHYQAPPRAQDKLVRCTRGRILDVAVDARQGSDQYGHWVSVELSAEAGNQFFVPKGFLHGFLTLEPNCEIQYKCSDFYAPECDGSVAWDSVGIDWGGVSDPLLSEKDQAAPNFADWDSPFAVDVK